MWRTDQWGVQTVVPQAGIKVKWSQKAMSDLKIEGLFYPGEGSFLEGLSPQTSTYWGFFFYLCVMGWIKVTKHAVLWLAHQSHGHLRASLGSWRELVLTVPQIVRQDVLFSFVFLKFYSSSNVMKVFHTSANDIGFGICLQTFPTHVHHKYIHLHISSQYI